MYNFVLFLYYVFIIGLVISCNKTSEPITPINNNKIEWTQIEDFFTPPDSLKDVYGSYRSPLNFYNGDTVSTVEGWSLRRQEIRSKWMELMGEWPPILESQHFVILDSVELDNYFKYLVTFHFTPIEETYGYLLVPKNIGKKKVPAVISVFYEPETAIGEGKSYHCNFSKDLTELGYITLSIATKKASNEGIYSIYYPSYKNAKIQPLSALAYGAVNAFHALANYDNVDANKIGIIGHSFGGKWAMFASCLYDKFACAVWSDPGIVFDDSIGNVNYWEPWYLGYYRPPWENTWRKVGMVEDAKGLYPKLMNEGFDLHELHALMAPRPFLVSGGSSDPVERWIPLNHTIQVNNLLGYQNRVAMTNREKHGQNPNSNKQMYDFIQYYLN